MISPPQFAWDFRDFSTERPLAQESPGQTRMVGSLGDRHCVSVGVRVRMNSKAGEGAGDKEECTFFF